MNQLMKYEKIKYKYLTKDEWSWHNDDLLGLDINTGYVTIKDGLLTVAVKYAWDGPSGPTIDTKAFIYGSLFHDALYQMMREGYLNRLIYREVADTILHDACVVEGMSKFRAWYVYKIVRACGEKHTKKKLNKIFEI